MYNMEMRNRLEESWSEIRHLCRDGTLGRGHEAPFYASCHKQFHVVFSARIIDRYRSPWRCGWVDACARVRISEHT